MNRKRIMGIVICMLFFCLFAWKLGDGRVYADQTGTVVTEGSALNLRAGIGTTYTVVTTIPNGSQITVVDTAAGTDTNGTAWYKVTYSGQEGYVSSKYVSLTTGTATSTATPTATSSATATPSPTVTPAPTATSASPTTEVTVYRTKTTYKAIRIPSKMKKTVTVCKSTSGKALQVNKKNVVLKKNKSVKIIGEKTKGKTKWFKISFKYKKKTRKGYVKSTDLKMVLSTAAGGVVTGVKTALRVRKKPGGAYYKVNGREMVLAKKQYISILKVRTVNKKQWYRISFEYYGKTYKGYVQAKYIKVSKTRVQKKVAVKVLSEQEFEDEMTRQGFPDSYKDAL